MLRPERSGCGRHWVVLAVALGCGVSASEEAASDQPCLTVSELRVVDASQPSPSSSCRAPTFGAAALAAFDAFAQALEAQWCEQSVRCQVHPNNAVCLDAQSLAPLGQVRSGIEAGRTGVVEAATQALIDWWAPAEGCARPGSAQVFASALQLVFPGQAAPGEACWESTDCAGAARCYKTDCQPGACCSGVCTPYRRAVNEGESCEVDECGPGLACFRWVTFEPSTSDMFLTCHPALPEGAECGNEEVPQSCEEGASCRPDPAGVLRCQAGPPVSGEGCRTNFGSLGCAELDVGCASDGVCQPRLPLRATCGVADACVQEAECSGTVCVPALALGSTCSHETGASPSCGYGLTCGMNRTCEPWPTRICRGEPG